LVRGTSLGDLLWAVTVGTVWFVGLYLLHRSSLWFPAPCRLGGLQLAGALLVLIVLLRRSAPTVVFWVVALGYPFFLRSAVFQADVLLLPLLVAAYAAAAARRAPVALLGLVSVVSALLLSLGFSRWWLLDGSLLGMIRDSALWSESGSIELGWFFDPSQTVMSMVLAFMAVVVGFAAGRTSPAPPSRSAT